MATSIIDAPETWVWPAEVRARLDAQRIAMPEKKPLAPPPEGCVPKAPTKAEADATDPTDELINYMFGGGF